MGGGGTYYSRDVTDRSRRMASGFSDVAQSAISRTASDPAMNPHGRKLTCDCKNPVVIAFDDTGSMGRLPKIIYDKMPMIAGQISEKQYLNDPMISLAAVGDQFSDRAPTQIGDFSPIKGLDQWLQRIYLEGEGGPFYRESYELTAYFYATRCELHNAEIPIFIFIGDEGFYGELNKTDLERHFNEEHQDITAKSVFDELKKKFMGNVFLVHRRYGYSGNNTERVIVKEWQDVLGSERVIILPEDLAIADIVLGIIALIGRKRTLDQYLEDMRAREQTPERVAMVRESLQTLAASLKPVPASGRKSGKKAVVKTTPNEPPRKKSGRVF